MVIFFRFLDLMFRTVWKTNLVSWKHRRDVVIGDLSKTDKRSIYLNIMGVSGASFAFIGMH